MLKKYFKLILIPLFLITNCTFAATLLTSLNNTVTYTNTTFRVNINPTFTFETNDNGGTVTSLVFQMNDRWNAPNYPDSIATLVQIQILDGGSILDTFTYDSYDSATKRVTLTGSAVLAANTSYTIKLGCDNCANVGFDLSSSNSNSNGWQFTSDYYGNGYPIMSLSGDGVGINGSSNNQSNPTTDTNINNLLTTQNNLSTRVATENVNPIKNRLHSLLVSPQNNTSNNSYQGVRLLLNINPTLNQFINTTGLLNQLNFTKDLFQNGWALWSAGEVILGDGKNHAEYTINSITLGADNRITPKLTTGLSLRLGKESSDPDQLTEIDSNFYSGSIYGSYALNKRTYAQGAIGYSYIDITSERMNGGNIVKGDRDANQFFLTLELTRQYIYKNIVLNQAYNNFTINNLIFFPYVALDSSFTRLDSYTETGPANSLYFNNQDVKTMAGILGVRVSSILFNQYGRFTPRLHFNYQNEFYSESETKMHYLSQPTTSYIRNSYSDSNSSFLAGLGLDYSYQNIILNGTYEYTKLIDWGHNHRFLLLARVYFD